MDREERLQALNKIEGQLSQYLAADKKNWIQTYLLMSEVQDKELYIVNYRSYTKWINHLADSLSIHVSTLWSRLKAGKNYAEYASRAREQGRIVPQIEEIDVSPDSLNLCAKVAGKNAAEMDKLVDQMVAGDLTRENLRQAAKARKAAGEFVAKSRFDCVQPSDRTEMEEKITAADIILALQSSNWLFEQAITNPVWEKVITDPRETVKKNYIKEKYRIFEEFSVDPGTSHHSRRLDALIVENISVPARADNPVNLIGVEIKVDINDLKNDCKMRTVCGRSKSDYSYSNTIVYNNFPWPETTDQQRQKIKQTAQAILDARSLYPDSSLADLYDPLTMPPELLKAHTANNKAVM